MSKNQFAAAENQDGDDPSMEEILASIRKIITDDDHSPEANADSKKIEVNQDEDVLELTEEEEITSPVKTDQIKVSPEVEDVSMTEETFELNNVKEVVSEVAQSQDDIDAMFAASETETAKSAEPIAEKFEQPSSMAMADAMAQAEEAMAVDTLSNRRATSIKTEISNMEERLLSEAAAAAAAASLSDLSAQVMMGRGNQSLEAIVKGVLKPLLKAWLDEHLPVIVEKLVRAEIDKITN